MADFFYDGMPNVNERLNLLYVAFAAGPYSAVPLVGGTMTGPLLAPQVYGYSVPGASNPRAVLGSIGEQEPSISLARWASSGVNDFVWSWINGFGNLQLTFSDVGAFDSAEQKSAREVVLSLVKTSVAGVYDLTSNCTYRGRFVVPRVDNAYDIGLPELAYRTVYARTGTISTSDARLKYDPRDLTPAEIAAARDIARAIGIYRWRYAVEEKGTAAREHVGPTVQRAIEIMQAHGLNPFNYGFICHDAWERQTVDHPAVEARPAVPATDAVPEVLDEKGAVVTPAVPASPGYPAIEARAAYTEVTLEAGDRYAFRYDELSMFIAAGQEARLAALEAA